MGYPRPAPGDSREEGSDQSEEYIKCHASVCPAAVDITTEILVGDVALHFVRAEFKYQTNHVFV